MKVMVTGAGAPGGPSAISGLKDAGHEVTTVDINSTAVGRHFANNFETISNAFSSDFINSLLNASLKHKAECILPLVTNELIMLSENLEIFRKNNIEVIITDKYNLKIANNKLRCYQILSSISSEIPKSKIPTEFTSKFKKLSPFQSLLTKAGTLLFSTLTKL